MVGLYQGGKVDVLSNFKLISADNISILKFGSIQYSEFPYFSYPQDKNVDSSFSLTNFLQSYLPSLKQLKDLNTNKSLARAVAAQILNNKPKPWHIIIVSDFLQDAKMNKDQRDFVDQIETCYLFEDLSAFSWKKNDNVRMKMMKVEKKPECVEEDKRPISKILVSLISPGHNKELKSGKSIRFQWKINETDVSATYGLYINYRKDKNKIFAKSNIKGTSYSVSSETTKKWKSGEYVWKVTAKTETKIIGRSSSRMFKVKGESYAFLLYLIVFAALLTGGYTVYKKIKEAKKEEAE